MTPRDEWWTTADGIAAKLLPMEREWITGWQGPPGAAFNAIASSLCSKGLLRGPGDWRVTLIGQAVRDVLLATPAKHPPKPGA